MPKDMTTIFSGPVFFPLNIIFRNFHVLVSYWPILCSWAQRHAIYVFLYNIYVLGYIWTSLIAQLVKNPPGMQETLIRFLGREDPLEKGQATYSSVLCFPCGQAAKEPTCNAGDLGLILWVGELPWRRERLEKGRRERLVQYSGLENSMDCIVHEVTKSQTQLSDFYFTSNRTNFHR